MDKETQILVLRDNAKHELLQIASVEQGLTYLNKVKALETWAEAEKKDAELVLIMAEQRIRTQGMLGRLIKEAQETGELLKSGQNKNHREHKNVAATHTNSHIKTLDEIGIDRSEASRFKRIAEIPQDKLEEHIHEKKEAGEKLTTIAVVRLADELSGKNNDKALTLKNAKLIQGKEELEERMGVLLQEINAWPKIFRMKIKERIK